MRYRIRERGWRKTLIEELSNLYKLIAEVLPPKTKQLTRVLGVSLECMSAPKLRRAACVRLRCSHQPWTRLETFVSRQQTLDHAVSQNLRPEKMVNQNIDGRQHWKMTAKLNEQRRREDIEDAIFSDRLHHLGDGLKVVWGSITPGPHNGGRDPGLQARPTGGAYEGLRPRLMSSECP
jgi:hypothetical protein